MLVTKFCQFKCYEAIDTDTIKKIAVCSKVTLSFEPKNFITTTRHGALLRTNWIKLGIYVLDNSHKIVISVWADVTGIPLYIQLNFICDWDWKRVGKVRNLVLLKIVTVIMITMGRLIQIKLNQVEPFFILKRKETISCTELQQWISSDTKCVKMVSQLVKSKIIPFNVECSSCVNGTICTFVSSECNCTCFMIILDAKRHRIKSVEIVG